MTTSSEDVLLSVNHVRYKKGDGTLYLMNQRIAWMVEHRDTVAISHKYADIKTQKISPAGKPKVQLQVVLHDGGCSTFHFVNPAGAEAQAQDRDQVKARLQSLLPLFRRQINRELEEKSRLLSLHPTLKHLYEDLVITKVLSSEEYWNTPTIKQYTENQAEKQDIGVSGAFLADIKPQTDGCNGLKYNLTQDIIESVFKTYPAVRKKHSDYVPNKMTEAEFWTKFFQSHYFHRDRIATSSKDLFTECGRLDDQQLSAAAQAAVAETTELDMARWNEPDPLQEDTTAVDNNSNSKGLQGQVASVHHNMIKRFNQHSIMVLKAGENTINNLTNNNNNNNNNTLKNGDGSAIVNGNGPSPEKREAECSSSGSVIKSQPNKRRRLLEKLQFDDLKSDEGPKELPQLELSKVERYLFGPNSNTGALSPPATSGSTVRQAARAARSLALGWAASGVSGQAGSQRPLQPLPQAIVGALGELSPGGALMRHHNTTSLAQLVPQDVEQEARRLYLGAGELLRAFWHCFPPAHLCQPPANAETIAKAHEALLRFRHAKVKPFEDKMVRELSPLAHSLTNHLSVLFQSATAKYNLWQSRQAKIR